MANIWPVGVVFFLGRRDTGEKINVRIQFKCLNVEFTFASAQRSGHTRRSTRQRCCCTFFVLFQIDIYVSISILWLKRRYFFQIYVSRSQGNTHTEKIPKENNRAQQIHKYCGRDRLQYESIFTIYIIACICFSSIFSYDTIVYLSVFIHVLVCVCVCEMWFRWVRAMISTAASIHVSRGFFPSKLNGRIFS